MGHRRLPSTRTDRVRRWRWIRYRTPATRFWLRGERSLHQSSIVEVAGDGTVRAGFMWRGHVDGAARHNFRATRMKHAPRGRVEQRWRSARDPMQDSLHLE